jgi:hypothetical protein
MFKNLTARRAEQRDLIIAYKQVFSTEQGRTVLFDLMNRNFILDSTNGEPLKEGRRAVVLDILKQVNLSLEQFDQLLKGELTAVTRKNAGEEEKK